MTIFLIALGIFGLVCIAAGYWFGEQTAYRGLHYYSEPPFYSMRFFRSAWFPR